MLDYKPEWEKMTLDEKTDMLRINVKDCFSAIHEQNERIIILEKTLNGFVEAYNNNVLRANREINDLKAVVQEMKQKEKIPA